MNRQKELARNTIILTVGKVCTQFVGFILLPLYTALLSPEEWGIVDLFNTYIALLTPIFNWQFESGLFRFMIDFRDEVKKQKELFSTVFFTNILQTICYVILFSVFQIFISSEYKYFLAFDLVANIFLNTFLQFSRGLGRNVVYSIGSFLSAVSMVVLNVLFIAVFRWGAYGMFWATLLAKIIACIYLVFALKAWIYISLKAIRGKTFKEVFKYSIPLVPNQLSWWVVGTSDRIIISKFINVATNGIYSVANKFSTVYVTFYNIFNLSWTESVSLHINDEDRDDFLTDTINTMFNLFVAIDFCIVAFMPFFFDIMVNAQYAEAYNQIPILMIAVLFQVVVGLYGVIYVALKKPTEIAKTSFFAAFINILVDLLLIKYIGMYAASFSTLVAYSVMAIYRYFDVKKYVTVRLQKRYIVSAILIGVAILIAYYSKSNILCSIVLVIVVLYSFLINKAFLLSIFTQFTNKIKRK